jgi:hypothetical protein
VLRRAIVLAKRDEIPAASHRPQLGGRRRDVLRVEHAPARVAGKRAQRHRLPEVGAAEPVAVATGRTGDAPAGIEKVDGADHDTVGLRACRDAVHAYRDVVESKVIRQVDHVLPARVAAEAGKEALDPRDPLVVMRVLLPLPHDHPVRGQPIDRREGVRLRA